VNHSHGERTAESSRPAILLAARRAFALHPYADVTIRSIAADAGVSAALVIKHFGTKEQLLRASADFTKAVELLLDAPLDRLGEHMVRTLISLRERNGADPLLRVVFSTSAQDERAVVREYFTTQVTEAMADRLTGPDARLRAELVIAHLLGLGATLNIHYRATGRTPDTERIVALYAPGIQQLITGP
jgi:AcrR family transcriptional regulator